MSALRNSEIAAGQPVYDVRPTSPVPVADFVLPEEYLRRERESATKHEYISGRIYAMAGGSPSHSVIGGNVITAVRGRLRGKPCRTYTSDQRVRATATAYCYPDVTVGCGEPRFDQDGTLHNPTIIFEVLSPTTEGFDRGEKFARYRLLDSLQEIVFVAQDRVRVERYARTEAGWTLKDDLSELDGILHLDSAGITVPVSELYEDALDL